MKGASVAPGACMVSGGERSGLGGGSLELRPSLGGGGAPGGTLGPPCLP